MDIQDGLTFTAAAAALLIAHPVGDYMVQTPHQATHKGLKGPDSWCGWWNAFKHAATYSLTLFLAVWGVLSALGWNGSVGTLALVIAANGVTHMVIDRRWTLEWFARTVLRKGPWIDNDPGALAHLDQAAHLAIFGPVALAVCALA